MAAQAKKIGVYICTGCGIGDALDIEDLSSLATSEAGATLCKTHPALCGDEGIGLIRDDLAAGEIDTVVLAACSFREKQEAFAFDGAVVERVGLREGVVWVLDGADEEDVQWLAEDYLRMGCAKAKVRQLPEPFIEEDLTKDILVVGGGISGLSAALEAARAGSAVTLVERGESLGGYVAKLHRSVASAPPYDGLEAPAIGGLIEEVTAHSSITVHTGAEIERIEGGPGRFDVTLRGGGTRLRAGAIVLATGFEPYDPTKLEHLGYGTHPDVVTSVELEEMARRGELARPSDGGPIRSVLFVQCAGSRDPDHLPYCSSVCCATTLKQALYLKESDPEAQAFVLYKDIRTPGQREDLYRRAQRDGAVFIKGDFKALEAREGKLTVTASDLLLGEDVAIEALDLVVLATGMVSTNRMEGETVEPLAGEDLKHGKILNLAYRQGPELPNLRYGAPDSHFICFPYETRRTGIYAAGTVRRPMDSAAARRDAAGAALKAIQCAEMTSRGEAVHPRAGDRSYPEFFMQRCTQCKRCTEECPFGAINEDEKGNPLPNPTRCRRCGTCMGACPERIISFKDYSIESIGNAIKAMEIPDEDEEKPCVLAFVCENDALPVLDKLALARTRLSPYIRVIPLRCMGSVNQVWIADALSRGVDGVLFFGCKHGDDYQCHFIKGSELCAERLSKLDETLERLMLESERVRFEEVSMNDGELVTAVFEEFMETIDDIGPNPFKGL